MGRGPGGPARGQKAALSRRARKPAGASRGQALRAGPFRGRNAGPPPAAQTAAGSSAHSSRPGSRQSPAYSARVRAGRMQKREQNSSAA